jgi:hypothetical protein
MSGHEIERTVQKDTDIINLLEGLGSRLEFLDHRLSTFMVLVMKLNLLNEEFREILSKDFEDTIKGINASVAEIKSLLAEMGTEGDGSGGGRVD